MADNKPEFNYKGENAVLRGMFAELIRNGMICQGNANNTDWFNMRDTIEDMFGVTLPDTTVIKQPVFARA